MNEHIRNIKKDAITTNGVMRRKYIRTGILAAAISAVMAINISVPTFAINKTVSTDEAIMNQEHPNKPEGNWEIEPLKSIPPKYDGHIHLPMPFVDGKLAVSLDRIDRTNSQIEFSISKKWLGQHKIKRIGFASVRWYGYAIDHAGLYEANQFDNEWTTKILASKIDYEEITDRHDAGDRYFWIKPTFDLFYEWSNDVVYMVQLDNDQYYNGRVIFKNDCMTDWKPGRDCRVKSFDTTKTEWNARYELHDAPKKYVEGMKLKSEDGYLNSDVNVSGVETSEKSDKPKESENLKEPEKTEEKTGEEKSEEKQSKEKTTKNKEDGKNEHQEAIAEKSQSNEGELKDKYSQSNNKNKELVLATQNVTEGKKNSEAEDDDETEIEVENETENVTQDGNGQQKSTNDKTNNTSVEVPKLGEIKNEKNIFILWWVWFIIGTVVGATLHKIFLSIRSKKKSISN